MLKEDVKLAIVQALACFDTPSQVIKLVKDEYGVDVSKQQVQHYDPTKANGAKVSKKLRRLFEVTREHFESAVSDIPIAKQSYRLRVLQRMLVTAERNPVLVAQLLEQAAKEVGGAFTNRRELTGKGGGPIAAQTTNITPEQLAEAVRSVRSEF